MDSNSDDIEHNVDEKNDTTHQLETKSDKISFKYESKFGILEYKCLSKNFIMKCPKCEMETKYIIQHLTKKSSCRMNIDLDTFKSQFQRFKSQFQRFKDKDKEKNLKKDKERKQIERAKLKEQNEEKVKEQRRNEKAARRQKLRAVDEQKVKEQRKMKKLPEDRS